MVDEREDLTKGKKANKGTNLGLITSLLFVSSSSFVRIPLGALHCRKHVGHLHVTTVDLATSNV